MSYDQIVCLALSEKDIDLLTRLLAELILADGNVSPLELDLFKCFVRLPLGDEPEMTLRSFTALTDVEISNGAEQPEALYLYCAVLACGDRHLDAEELALLRRYGKALTIDLERCQALETMARNYVLDQAAQFMWKIPGQPYDKANYLTVIARRLGATEEEIDEAWANQGATE